MKKMDKIVNLIKIGLLHKKKIMQTKVEKNEINMIKILIKLNIITYLKKIKNNIYIIKLNNNYNLKIKNNFRKKKITIKKNEKTNKNKIIIISNNYGIRLWDRKVGGILLWSIGF